MKKLTEKVKKGLKKGGSFISKHSDEILSFAVLGVVGLGVTMAVKHHKNKQMGSVDTYVQVSDNKFVEVDVTDAFVYSEPLNKTIDE